MRLLDIPNGPTINLDEVRMVGKVGGDKNWLSYNVYFRGVESYLVIYQERKDNSQMPRETFMKHLRGEI